MKTFAPTLSLLLLLTTLGQAQQRSQLEKDSLQKLGKYYFDKSEKAYFTSLDSSLYYTNLAQPYFEKAEDWENYVNCFTGAASIYSRMRNFERNEYYCKLAMENAEKYLDKKAAAYVYAKSNMALMNRQKSNYDRAIELYKEALRISEEKEDKTYIGALHLNIASAYWYKGDYDVSLDYFNKTLQLYQNGSKAQKNNITNVYSFIGKCYDAKNELDSALVYYQKSLDAIPEKMRSTAFGTRRQIIAYQYIAEVYLDKKEYESCNDYIARALRLQTGEQAYRLDASYNLLGKLSQEKKDYDSALANFQKSLDISKEEFKHYEKSREIALKLAAIAEMYDDKKDYTQAVNYYQEALIALAEGFDNRDPSVNPSTEQLLSRLEAMHFLQSKGAIYYKKYLKSQTTPDLLVANNCYQKAVQLIQLIRQSHLAEGSKQDLAENTASIYEGAITVALALHQSTNEAKYLEAAFALAESNKAILLLESINANTAKGFAGLPNDLLQKEQELKVDIAFYEQQLSQEQQRQADRNTDMIKTYEDRLFDLKQDYNQLIERFEQDYPAYHELKYNTTLASTDQIRQDLLQTQEALLEYFVGEEKAWLFVHTTTQLQVFELSSIEELPDAIAQLRSIIDTAPEGRDAAQDYRQFGALAHQLYRQLLQPAEGLLASGIQKLYIIPDHQLNYIPFEILLREAAPETVSYSPNKLAYLFEDFTISYDYSATLLRKNGLAKPSQASNNFIGFAPSFGNEVATAGVRSCDEEGLYSLRCSQNEVESILELVEGSPLLALQANKAAFKQEAKDYRILHLATHACINEQDPMLNRIYLADGFISNYELYNLQLNADLAVLSACNTGSGKLVRGEGVMSLSRGFIHAGCPSTLMSLWSVDDCATSTIMLGFYEQLSQGQPKDEAMHQARLNYLASADKSHRHPYYWAAFVQFGTPVAIDFQNGLPYWLALPLALLLLLGFSWWRKNS
ncbi:MAG: CHAT domain-containing protein [Bacteroidota bacterium]